MSIRQTFIASNVTASEYWGRRMAIELSRMQTLDLIDGFSVRPISKVKERGVIFEIKGAHSDVRYENHGLLAKNGKPKAEAEKFVIMPRKKLKDFYINVSESLPSMSPVITFSAIGHTPHINKIGGVKKVDFIDEVSFAGFLFECENAFGYMEQIFARRSQEIQQTIKVHNEKASKSPWGQCYRHV